MIEITVSGGPVDANSIKSLEHTQRQF